MSKSKWIRSSACKADQPMCVEAHFIQGGDVLLRSSVNPASTITVTDAEWDVFLAGVREGEFDRP